MNGRAKVKQQPIITPDFDSKNKSANLREVHRLIAEFFDLSGLNTLCFGLGIDFEDLSGSNKNDKIRELIKYTIHHGRLSELLESLQKERPNVIWPSVEYLPQDRPFPFIKNIIDFRGCAFQFGSIAVVISLLVPILFVAGIWFISSFEFLNNAPTPTPTSLISIGSFDYFVAVRDRNTRDAIDNARVLIQSPGNAAIINFTDANGHASFRIPERISGQVGKIEVQADNYELYIQNLTIVTDQLPAEIQLIASATSTPTSVSNLELTLTLASTSTSTPTSTPIPPLVVANFDDLNFEKGVVSDSNCMIETRTEEPGQGRVARLSYILKDSQIYWIKLEGANANPYNWLTFEIRTDRSPELPQDILIELKRANNSEVGTAYISQAAAFPGISEEWQTVSIALEQFTSNGTLSSQTQLSELIFKVEAEASGRQGVIYLDNIRFTTGQGELTEADFLVADFENLESPHINNLGGEMGVVSDPNCLIETSQEEAGHGEVLRLQYILAHSQIYWIKLNSLDISTYNWLVLDIRADNSPHLPESVQIELKDETKKVAAVDITEAVEFSKISEEWQTVRLSLMDFVAVNSSLSLTDISELIIKVDIEKSGDQGVIYIDNIQFEP